MIAYETDVADVRAEDLEGFFVGWPTAPSPDRHLALLHGSDYAVVARDSDTGGIVGFVTAHSDGVLSAYAPLLEVRPRTGAGESVPNWSGARSSSSRVTT